VTTRVNHTSGIVTITDVYTTIGYCRYDPTGEVEYLFVSPAFRRRGYGRSQPRVVAFVRHAITSLVILLYTSNWTKLETGEDYALGADAYRPFLQRYPSRSQLKSQGKYLSFPAVVKTPTGDRTMNCTQFFKPDPPKGGGYSWIWVALMCVNSGETPEAVADLISDSIKVNIK